VGRNLMGGSQTLDRLLLGQERNQHEELIVVGKEGGQTTPGDMTRPVGHQGETRETPRSHPRTGARTAGARTRSARTRTAGARTRSARTRTAGARTARPTTVPENTADSLVGNGPLHAELQITRQIDLSDHRLDQHLSGDDIEFFQDIANHLVVARRSQDDKRVGDVIGDNAYFFLEDRFFSFLW